MQATSPSISYSIFDAPIENPSSWEEVHNIQETRFAKLGKHIHTFSMMHLNISSIFWINSFGYNLEPKMNTFVRKKYRVMLIASTYYLVLIYITPRLNHWSP